MIVTLHGVVVGLNGGFVQIAQLGANCLSGVECQVWYEKTQPYNCGKTPINHKTGTQERTREPLEGNV